MDRVSQAPRRADLSGIFVHRKSPKCVKESGLYQDLVSYSRCPSVFSPLKWEQKHKPLRQTPE